ncbi:MAG: PAS domain-containing protein, partial [Gallionella sp.]|nr:PAS domain-containing protein [Gallionella sp.]
MRKKPNDLDSLRKQAEAQLARAPRTHKTAAKKSKENQAQHAAELLHELQVQQVELEMQNEELRQAQVSLEESRDHYIDFYDFAPVGYITLTDKGMISEINITGAALLGVERNKLLRQRFARFIAPEENDRYHQHFFDVLKSNEKQTGEMIFKRGDGSKFDAQLDCIRFFNEGKAPVVRIVLTDISARKQVEEVVREQEE